MEDKPVTSGTSESTGSSNTESSGTTKTEDSETESQSGESSSASETDDEESSDTEGDTEGETKPDDPYADVEAGIPSYIEYLSYVTADGYELKQYDMMDTEDYTKKLTSLRWDFGTEVGLFYRGIFR